jgi:hypothetical protein
MVMMVVVIVRMRVGDTVMGMFMRVGRAGSWRVGMRMIVVPVVVRVLVSVCDLIVAVGVRMLGHGHLLSVPARIGGVDRLRLRGMRERSSNSRMQDV